MVLLLAFFSLAVVVSFLCSIMEAVLLSTPTSFLLVKEEKGHRWATSFAAMKRDINKPLAAILSLNTIAHTIGAAGVGAQAVSVFGEEYFGLISAILTIIILVVTEIIPKTLGARYWRKLGRFAYFSIRVVIVLTYPLVVIATMLSGWLSRDAQEYTTSREEIAALASIGVVEGIFSDKENKIIQNIIRLKNVSVRDIMTPRVVLALADENLPLRDFLKTKDYLKFSRIPIYSGNDENITGYVFRQEVFENLAEDKDDLRLKDLRKKILITSNKTVLFTLWEKLLQSKEHIALIVDEYGGVDGIVTMEDIVETLLGLEIVDEKDTVVDMQQYARERWQKRQAKYRLLEQADEKPPKDAP